MVRSAPATDLTTLALTVSILPPLRLRPYSPTSDLPVLESICSEVYGGGDYLPAMAASMAADSSNTLLVLTDDDDMPVSIANLKRISPTVAWLEAVRTATSRRGAGLASRLCSALAALAATEGRRVLTATVASNAAMLRSFVRCGFEPFGTIHLLSWSALKALPGWASGSTAEPQSLLRALGLEEAHVTPAVRARAARFERLRDTDELRRALASTGDGVGGSGCMPGLYKLLGDEALGAALADGGVYWLSNPACLMALSSDASVSSLRSQVVCSICLASRAVGVGSDAELAADVDATVAAALWRASEEHGHRPFCLAVDGAVPVTPGGLLAALPLNSDQCVLHGAQLSRDRGEAEGVLNSESERECG